MAVAKGAQAPAFEREGITARSGAVPSRGSTELAAWSIEIAPGAKSAPHSVDREEIFVVIAGELSARIDEEDFSAGEGDTLIVKPNTPFQIFNRTSNPVRAVCITSAGMQATIGEQVITPPWSR